MDSKMPSSFKKGLTMPEILIGIGLIGIIALFVASVYFAHFRLFSNQVTIIDVATQNKIALDEMTNEIRESQQVAASCCGGDTTGANVLVLQLWPLNASGEPQDPSGNYDYIIYKRDPLDNTKLLKKIVPGSGSTRAASSKIIATNLGTNAPDLSFTYDNVDPTQAAEVTASITTTRSNLGKTKTVPQSSKAILRNK